MEKTTFVDKEGKLIGESPSLLTVSLYKGMEVRLKDSKNRFQVDGWEYHEGKGLIITLASLPEKGRIDIVDLDRSNS